MIIWKLTNEVVIIPLEDLCKLWGINQRTSSHGIDNSTSIQKIKGQNLFCPFSFYSILHAISVILSKKQQPSVTKRLLRGLLYCQDFISAAEYLKWLSSNDSYLTTDVSYIYIIKKSLANWELWQCLNKVILYIADRKTYCLRLVFERASRMLLKYA